MVLARFELSTQTVTVLRKAKSNSFAKSLSNLGKDNDKKVHKCIAAIHAFLFRWHNWPVLRHVTVEHDRSCLLAHQLCGRFPRGEEHQSQAKKCGRHAELSEVIYLRCADLLLS